MNSNLATDAELRQALYQEAGNDTILLPCKLGWRRQVNQGKKDEAVGVHFECFFQRRQRNYVNQGAHFRRTLFGISVATSIGVYLRMRKNVFFESDLWRQRLIDSDARLAPLAS